MPAFPPPIEIQSDPVANVTVGVSPDQAEQQAPAVEAPPKVAQIFPKVISGQATPEENKHVATELEKASKATPYLHVNEQMQLPGMIASALNPNLRDAIMGVWRYYNGGPVEYQQARGADGKIYMKGYNANGFNGRVTDENNHELSKEEYDALQNKGGVLSGRDAAILRTANYDKLNDLQKLFAQGQFAQSMMPFANSVMSGNSATNLHNLRAQQLAHIHAIKDQSVFDRFAKLSPEKRAEIALYVNDFSTANKGVQNQNSSNVGGNVGQNAANSKSTGMQGSASLGFPSTAAAAPGGIIPPTPGAAAAPGITPSATGGISSNQNNTLQNNVGLTLGQNAASSTSSNTGAQLQSNALSKINSVFQGGINGEDLVHFLRAQELEDAANKIKADIPKESLPPGYTTVAPINMLTDGRDNIIQAAVADQKNAALHKSYADHVFNTWKEASKSGDFSALDNVAKNFENSDQFKGINNTYDEKTKFDIMGLPRKTKEEIEALPPEMKARLGLVRDKSKHFVEIGTNRLLPKE